MSWAVGTNKEGRDVGYGVPCKCDVPNCDADIDRGLAYVCGGMHDGGENGCGRYMCAAHLHYGPGPIQALCTPCLKGAKPYPPKPDVREWIEHKLTHESWQRWRDGHPEDVEKMRAAIA